MIKIQDTPEEGSRRLRRKGRLALSAGTFAAGGKGAMRGPILVPHPLTRDLAWATVLHLLGTVTVRLRRAPRAGGTTTRRVRGVNPYL